jgi:hypothetical protein
MPVFPDFGRFPWDNRTRGKCRGKPIPNGVLLAIPLAMGYHAPASALGPQFQANINRRHRI